MEIQNKLSPNFFKKFIGIIKKNRALKVIFLLSSMFIFSFGCIIYGGYLNKTRQNIKIGKFVISLSEFDFSFIPNKINGLSAKVEKFNLDIKFIDFEKLRYDREKALKRVNKAKVDKHQEVPATLKYNGEIYNVSVSLTGIDGVIPSDMHIIHPNKKWSYAIKVKDGKTIMGMRKFALLVPRARGYLTDWIAIKLLKSRDVIGIRNDFIEVDINGENLGIFYLEEKFDKRLLENNNRKEGIIFRLDKKELSIQGKSKVLESDRLSSQAVLLQELWYKLLNDEIEPHEFFDFKKLASFAVVSDIMDSKHALGLWNMRFYFNPYTLLCEPIGREWQYLQEPVKNRFITLFDNDNALLIEKPKSHSQTEYHEIILDNSPMFKNGCGLIFKELYLKEAEILSRQSYLDSVLLSDNALDTLLKKVYKENPFYKFPLEELHKNQDYILKKINPEEPIIETYFDGITKDSISILVKNKIDLPVEISYLNYNSDKIIIPPNRMIIEANFESNGEEQTITFPLPTDENRLSFSTDFLEVYFSILGLRKIKKTIVFPKKFINQDISILNNVKQIGNINEFKFLSINEKSKTIEFLEKKCEISKDLIIPEGYFLTAKPGCNIDLTNSAKIISYSPLLFFGRRDSLINISSSDNTGQGILVLNSKKISELSYVSVDNLSNISEFGWNLQGVITFYESPINMINCILKGNLSGNNILNIVRTDFNIVDTNFTNIFSNAFGSNYSRGNMKNVKFINVQHNAIDISGTNMKIDSIFMDKIGYTGINIKEESQLIAKNVTIENSKIAICSKDKSKILVSDIALNNNQIGFTAFQSKFEFGPGFINGSRVKIENTPIQYLIESNSTCTIDGKIKISNTDKEKNILNSININDN